MATVYGLVLAEEAISMTYYRSATIFLLLYDTARWMNRTPSCPPFTDISLCIVTIFDLQVDGIELQAVREDRPPYGHALLGKEDV